MAQLIPAGEPVDGDSLAHGLTRLSGGDAAPDVRPGEFARGAGLLAAGQEIDYEGASGHLEFDPLTGDTAASVGIALLEAGTMVAWDDYLAAGRCLAVDFGRADVCPQDGPPACRPE